MTKQAWPQNALPKIDTGMSLKNKCLPFVPDKMKMERPEPRTALIRCPATGSEVFHRRLGNAWAAEKSMPTED